MENLDVSQIIHRMKNLRLFTVEVDLPTDFVLHGVMPFDVAIKENKGRFKVYALSMEEASEKINEFINSQSN